MPEIAEVETVRNTLKKQILHKRIKYVKVLYKNIIEPDSKDLMNIVNDEFIDINRKGKWLIFNLNNNNLLSHLRMEGKFFLKHKDEVIDKHEHVIIGFDDFELRYHDTRKFGRMILLNKEDTSTYKGLKKLGIEPLDSSLTKEYLFSKLNKKVFQ